MEYDPDEPEYDPEGYNPDESEAEASHTEESDLDESETEEPEAEEAEPEESEIHVLIRVEQEKFERRRRADREMTYRLFRERYGPGP